jgi:nitroimidazol reductase NimA-like FMN-containing flavoprotein (pyridoxamine 5'-phosphate oxidase superfamily)
MMVIREMTHEKCMEALARTGFFRLGCANGNQPYIVPVSLVYHHRAPGEACLYGVTIPGQKVEWMRANPLVCVEMDEVRGDDRWLSVIAFGRYEELPESSAVDGGEPGGVSPLHYPERSDLAHAAEALHVSQDTGGMPAAIPVEPERTKAAALAPPSGGAERSLAYRLLSARAAWWERGWATWQARPHTDPAERYRIVYYKIRIDRITGHEATRAAADVIPTDSGISG